MAFQNLILFSLKHLLLVPWIGIRVHLAIVANNYWKTRNQRKGCKTRQASNETFLNMSESVRNLETSVSEIPELEIYT